jgi:methyl coenzyme M reductase gamma subunit
MSEKWLKEHTTMFRADGVDMRADEEVMRQNLRIHTLRSKCGFKPFDVKED